MNNWEIRRSKSFLENDILIAVEVIRKLTNNNKIEVDTSTIGEKLVENPVFSSAKKNTNEILSRFRDHGLLTEDNKLGYSAIQFADKKYSFGELVLDLFIKRPAKKKDSPNVKPLVLICMVFDIMMRITNDPDDVFLTYSECKEYLFPIDDYSDITYEYVEKIIQERQYDATHKLLSRVTLEDNEDTNFSIWFNALRQTPVFMPTDNGKKQFIAPNQKQKEFFKYIAENAVEFSVTPTDKAKNTYDYYCDEKTGFREILSPVVKETVNDIDEDIAKIIFEYLFGYDEKVGFNYLDYLKHECFGTYFAFISIPDIAIAKIEEDNPQIADLLYKYVRNMGTYYLDNIDIALDNLKSGEKAVSGIITVTKSNEENFIKWLHTQRKSSGEPYKENTVSQYTSALKAVSVKFDLIPIFSIESVEVFDEIDQQIRNNPDFERFNKARGNGALSAGLIAYRKFLTNPEITPAQITLPVENDITSAWFVGAQYDGTDHTDVFVKEGIWRYGGERIDIIDTVKAGDKIAIKAMCVQKNGLPFENYGKSISCLIIKAIGTVVENLNSENTLVVDWERLSPEKRWYVYTGKLWGTVGKISKLDGNNYKNLIEFAFEGKPQPYEDIDIQPDVASPDDETKQTSTPSSQTIDTVDDEPVDFEYKEIVMEPKQVIYYGAPGTGKSFEVDKQLIEKYPDEDVRDYHTARVVFHPDYTYSDFVGSIRPVKPDGKPLTYEFVAGPFCELLKKCFLHSDEEFYLVLEEINRGNAAAIFGDLFQLLDRNDKKGKSRYRINNTDIAGFLKKDKRLASLFVNDKIWLPSNFNIVCTMNTADQNVFVLDSAFKRRFSEEYTAIDFSKLTKELKEATTVFNGTTDLQQLFANTNLKNFIDKLAESGDLNRDWPTFAKIANYIIDDINEESGSEQISEDKKLGPFFVSVKDLESRKNFINKVLHYLKQDVFKYVDFYFTESYQTIHSKYINETADIFNLLKRQGE